MTSKIAIIGAGVSGLTCAHYLSSQFKVSLFEANSYIGGHTNTVKLPSGPDEGLSIDTGFIVLNDQNYPNFTQLLKDLQVPIQASDMSFGVYSQPNQLVYGSDMPAGIFAQKRNLFKPSFIQMLLDIRRFNRRTLADLDANAISDTQTLGQYLKKYGYRQMLIDQYIVPMSAAIWSASESSVLDYPALAFFKFWKNHGLLYHGLPEEKHNPKWKTVQGGSQAYVQKILKDTPMTVHKNTPIERIQRDETGVTIHAKGESHKFDKVIIATHADQALRLLETPTDSELRLLSPWLYSKNKTVLHTDQRMMPPQRGAWSSWMFYRSAQYDLQAPVTVSYYMNRLQQLEAKQDYFVTLNPPFDLENTLYETVYTHPIFTPQSMSTQAQLPQLNGVQHTYFCGSYFGYGFHEDAVTAATKVIKQIKEER